MISIELEQAVNAVFCLRELLDLAHDDVCVAMLRPLLCQQALHVLRLDCVCLLPDQLFNTLLFVIVLFGNTFANPLLSYVSSNHSIVHALLDALLLKIGKLLLDLSLHFGVLIYHSEDLLNLIFLLDILTVFHLFCHFRSILSFFW